MQYLITGITGLVGSYLAQEALQRGYKVIGLKRKNSDLGLVEAIAGQIKWIEGNVLDIFSLEEALSDANGVVHAAGLVSFDPADHKSLLKTNVEGTANIVNTCLAKGNIPLCHISSIAALGKEKNKDLATQETTQWENGTATSQYSLSKFLAEQEVWRAYAEGLEVLVLNPSVVLGVGSQGKSTMQIFDYLGSKPTYFPPGDINYVDARDLATICFDLIEKKVSGERFIVNAGSTSYQSFFDAIAERLEVPPPKKPLSPLLAAIAWRWEALLAFVTRSTPKLTKSLAKSAFQKEKYNGQKLVETLNFSYRPLQETLDWVAEAYKKKY